MNQASYLTVVDNHIRYFGDVSYFYTVVGIISFITILLVSNRIRSTKYKDIVDRPFVHLLNFFVLFCLADASWGVFAFLSHPGLEVFTRIPFLKYIYIFLTYMFHGLAALSAFMGSGYIVNYLNPSPKSKKILNILRIFLFAFQIICLLINFVSIESLRAFFFDENGVYQSADFRNFLFFLQFCHYIMVLIFSIICLCKDRNKKMQQKATYAIVFSIVPFVMGIGQMCAPDLAFYSLGFMLSSIIIYIFNVTSQRELFLYEKYDSERAKQEAIIKSLSNDYEAMFVVNLFTNKYEIITNSTFFKEKISPYLIMGEDFFADRALDFKNIVYCDDYQMVSEKITKKYILNQFEFKQSFNFNFRVEVGNKIKCWMMKCVYSSSHSKDQRLVIGIYDVDSQVRECLSLQEQLEFEKKSNQETMKESASVLYDLSRNFKLSLNLIIGYTNIAKKNMTDNEILLYLSKITNSTDFLLRLNDDIMEISKLESGNIRLTTETISIRSCIDSIVPTIKKFTLDKNIDFSYEIKNIKDDNVICDYIRVTQVLKNILFNAIRFTKNNGKIHFCVEQINENNENIYKFSISDNGIGISCDFLPKIFNDFSKEESRNILEVSDSNLGCGCGLGLSIAKKLVDLMKGKIEIISEKNKGTTVEVYLPLLKSIEQEEHVALSLEKMKTQLAGKKVLIVDDDSTYIEIITDMLKEQELVVESANEGFVAIDMIKSHPFDYYDFILMDIKMRKIDGYKTSEIISALPNLANRHIPIIALSATDLSIERERMQKVGIDCFVSKTDDFSHLLCALKDLNK